MKPHPDPPETGLSAVPSASELAASLLRPSIADPVQPAPPLEVYGVAGPGPSPEVMAYAMARYSRSAVPLRQAIEEISDSQAADFLNRFYFDYGHRSIADLAHAPFAIENLSILAAIEVVDEPRWDGQERSTRYQDFSRREVYCPDGLTEAEYEVYTQGINGLFDGYDRLTRDVVKELRATIPCPDTMKPERYDRIIRARAFDVARYLLPLATLTSVGQIVSARTLEGQISRLLGSIYPEVRLVGEKLRLAAIRPAYNPLGESIGLMVSELRRKQGDDLSSAAVANRIEKQFRDVSVAPTLVKHTSPNPNLDRLRAAMQTYIDEVMAGVAPDMPDTCSVVSCRLPRVEIAATLLYPWCHYPMAQIYYAVESSGRDVSDAIIGAALALRGPHEELGLAFRTGFDFVFDIHMDTGGYRDLHRHRRCTQIAQPVSPIWFDQPEWVEQHPDAAQRYNHSIWEAERQHRRLASLLQVHHRAPEIADYLLPLGVKRRFLMKMDLAEAAYIAELRTQPGGHISYRRVAWSIYRAIEEKYPVVAKNLRVSNPDESNDPLVR